MKYEEIIEFISYLLPPTDLRPHNQNTLAPPRSLLSNS